MYSALQQGWAVTVPDYEGPGSAYSAGPLEGHGMLDGIRAVRSFSHDGIGAGTRWALDGYSGGAQKLWLEAELKRTRADRDIDWIVVVMHQVVISTVDRPLNEM